MSIKFVNLTPHAITLNDGKIIPASGEVVRVSTTYSDFDSNGVAVVEFGEPVGLPAPQEGVLFIVSGLLKQACPDRQDLVSPATGHPACVRDGQGRIVSVPGFVR